jgi:lauroyl/myristoyl acyltransferase
VVVGVPAPRDGQEADGDGPRLELAITRIPTADLDASPAGERILTGRINDVLSARIQALAASWVWMHPRWGPSPCATKPLPSRGIAAPGPP